MDNMSIDFKYKLHNSEDWLIKSITIEQYFDMSLIDGGVLDINSPPLHDDLVDYFDSERQKIYQISISIIDASSNAKLHFFKTFWNEQKNSLVERIDTIDECEQYHEWIISTELPSVLNQENSELTYQVMRFRKKENDIRCVYDVIGFIHNNSHGSPSDIVIEPRST